MRPVTLLTDYGTTDEFAGVLHAVIARIAPDARIVDLGHGIPRHDVVAGALVLERTLPYAPAGVHVAVVDPGVGGPRRALALRTAAEDRLLVGPDNGLLLPAAARFGGVAEAVEISASPWRLEPVSATFHGRDLFAPVAARLAAGARLADAGTPLDADDLVALELPRPEVGETVVAAVARVDGFGNIALHAHADDLAACGLRAGDDVRVRPLPRAPVGPGEPARTIGRAGLVARYGRTFADVALGEPARARGLGRARPGRPQRGRRRGRARARGRRPGGARAGVSALGRPRIHLRTTGSTNDRARALAAAGAPHGTLVTTGEQTAGRGRQGRTWLAPAGQALLLSLVLRDPDALLPLRAGLAVADVAGAAARVKWPNDVLLDGRKLAGILVEARPQDGWAVLGIGLNAAVDLAALPAEVRARAATLGRPPEAALAELLPALERRLAEPADRTLAALRERDALLGAPVRWEGGEGTGAGIADDGALLVRTDDGLLAPERRRGPPRRLNAGTNVNTGWVGRASGTSHSAAAPDRVRTSRRNPSSTAHSAALRTAGGDADVHRRRPPGWASSSRPQTLPTVPFVCGRDDVRPPRPPSARADPRRSAHVRHRRTAFVTPATSPRPRTCRSRPARLARGRARTSGGAARRSRA